MKSCDLASSKLVSVPLRSIGPPCSYFVDRPTSFFRVLTPPLPLPLPPSRLVCRGGAPGACTCATDAPSAAYIACSSLGDWWKPENAWGDAIPVGKKLPMGEDGGE